MGTPCSRPPPPPLVEVTGPHNKILVPAGSAFTFHPPPELRGRRGPKIQPYYPVDPYSSYPDLPHGLYSPPPPYPFPSLDRRPRGPRRGGGGFPPGGAKFHNPYPEDSESSEQRERGGGFERVPQRMHMSREKRRAGPGPGPEFGRKTGLKGLRERGPGFDSPVGLSDVSPDSDISEMRNGRYPGGGGRRGSGGGRGMPMGGGNANAPELGRVGGGGYPGMQGDMMGGGGMPNGYGQPGMGGGMQPGMGGGMGMGGIPGGMQPGMAVYAPGGPPGLAGMPGGNMAHLYQQQQEPHPVMYQPQPQPQPQPPQPLQPPPRPQRHNAPPGHTAVPMGAFATSSSVQSPDPPPAARLNRGKHPDKRAGPQGQEWLEGDPFLDACFCTTNCNCRKGHRVVYRERMGDGQTAQGEVRYLVKDMLGRDCGDHSHGKDDERRKRQGGGGGAGWKNYGNGKEKRGDRDCESGNEAECRAARMEARQASKRMHESLENLNARLDGLTLQKGGGASTGPRVPMGMDAGMGMGNPAVGLPGQGFSPNARMQQYPGMAAAPGGGQPQMMGMAAQQMGGGMNQQGMRSLGMMPRGDINHRMGFGVPYGMDQGYSPSMHGMSAMMGGGPAYDRHRRRGVKERQPPGMDYGLPPRGPMRGRGGLRGGRGGKRRRNYYDINGEHDDEFQIHDEQGGGGEFGQYSDANNPDWTDMNDDEDEEEDDDDDDDEPRMGRRGSSGGRPGGRGRGGGRNIGRLMSERGGPGNRARQAHVRDGEDEDEFEQ
ncbi:hypothetical protein K504DRAFT_445726 [Pleomassaria siparia CBS 279.74]|uniref:Uncharacterized protein n=1 Tax=Pleomassaria siparia CBS 279.74 TaxID=1314801 RepID=A0A6G1KPP2_9PLEO|nr:hypothetical protein K504DRAFT_445726 [Pleomassaria siparia CBS 279.74]